VTPLLVIAFGRKAVERLRVAAKTETSAPGAAPSAPSY
jgi:hypothetical protein